MPTNTLDKINGKPKDRKNPVNIPDIRDIGPSLPQPQMAGMIPRRLATGVQNNQPVPQPKPVPKQPAPVTQQAAPASTQPKTTTEGTPPPAPKAVETVEAHARTTPQQVPDAVESYVNSELQRTEGKQPRTYTELFNRLHEGEVLTPEQQAKEDKKRKREAILSAVGDGISALANLHFTSQDAPNMYDPKNSLSAKNYARWENLKKERDAKKSAYEAAYLRAMGMDDAADARNRSYRASLYNMLNSKRNAEKNYDLSKSRFQYQQDKDEEERRYKRDRDKKGDEQANARLEEQKRHNRRSEQISSTRAAGTGRPGEYPWYDRDGNMHYAHSYESMRQNAIHHGTWVDSEDKSVRVRNGEDSDQDYTTTTTKPGKGHSQQPEKKFDKNNYKRNKGGSNKAKPTPPPLS